MAVERFIHGKKDDKHHDGKASEIRRSQEADYLLETGVEEILEEGIIFNGRMGKKRGSLLHKRWEGEIESSEA